MSTERRVIPIDYVAECAERLAEAASRPWFIFLDSCTDRALGGRYDIISAEPRMTLTTRGEHHRDYQRRVNRTEFGGSVYVGTAGTWQAPLPNA